MNLSLKRLTSADDPLFPACAAIYAQSFPPHEQREAASQRAIMGDGEYHYDAILLDGALVGEILNWRWKNHIYVEHFCIDPARRGQGLGRAALDLLAGAGDTIILEIDPPVDEISRRRRRFYAEAGFCENPHAHVHPPYHAGADGHALVVMSRPKPIDGAQYAEFRAYLQGRVIALCPAPREI